MVEENINWRTFDDNDRSIDRQWNRPATPAMFLIDHKGVIRHKWTGKVGGKAIDAAVDRLISEVRE